MTDHDVALLERLRAEPRSVAVDADDPGAVGEHLAGAGARLVSVDDVPGWVVEAALLRARAEAVLAAEHVVAGALDFERARRTALMTAPAPERSAASGSDAGEPHDDGPGADRAAVRFALVVLAVAQAGGVAVYLADRLLLAVVVPAAAIVGVVAVAVAHRRPPRRSGTSEVVQSDERSGTGSTEDPHEVAAPVEPRSGAGPPASPAVRAAEAHLRRQQAAWKLAWWERELPPADVGTWLRGPAGEEPATLVVVDPGGHLDQETFTAMSAALPAAVRLVLVRSRAE